MKKVTNELEIGGGVASIRQKYKGAHGGKSKINYAVVKESTKKSISSGSGEKGVSEEKIIIKKESQSSRIVGGSPAQTSSKITTKTVIQAVSKKMLFPDPCKPVTPITFIIIPFNYYF